MATVRRTRSTLARAVASMTFIVCAAPAAVATLVS